MRPSAMLLRAAETLVADLGHGEMAALPPDLKCQLRHLSLSLAAWSDVVATMEGELARTRRRPAWRRLLRVG